MYLLYLLTHSRLDYLFLHIILEPFYGLSFVVRLSGLLNYHAFSCCTLAIQKHSIIMDTNIKLLQMIKRYHAKLFSTSALSSPVSKFAN